MAERAANERNASVRSELTLAHRLGRLIDYKPDAKGERQSHYAIAAGVSEILRREVRSRYIQQMLAGSVAEPDVEVLAAIALHFNVPESYLTGTSQQQNDFELQLDFYEAMRGSGATILALRTREDQIDPDAARTIATLIETTRKRYQAPRDGRSLMDDRLADYEAAKAKAQAALAQLPIPDRGSRSL